MVARRPVLPVVVVCCLLTGWLVWAVPRRWREQDLAWLRRSPFREVQWNPTAWRSTTLLACRKATYIFDQAHNKLDKFTARVSCSPKWKFPAPAWGS